MHAIAWFFKTELARKLATILDCLTPLLRLHAGRDPKNHALILPTWKRFRALIGRLESLTLRWKAGKNLTPRKAQPRNARPKAEKPEIRLPTRRFWLLHIAQPTAQVIPLVHQLLDDPETQALFAAAPQLGRILRPLCHAFGVDLPAYLQLPPCPPRPRKPKPKPEKPRQAYPFHGVPRRWQTRIPGINAPKLKNGQN